MLIKAFIQDFRADNIGATLKNSIFAYFKDTSTDTILWSGIVDITDVGVETPSLRRQAAMDALIAFGTTLSPVVTLTYADFIWPYVIDSELAPVAFSGNYSDLSGQPTIPSAQIQSDWNATSGLGKILNKPTIPSPSSAYEGTTQRSGAFPIFKSATVASGVAVFNLTTDGTSGGAALFPNGVIADSVNVFVSDATASYQMSYAFSNSNKTLTVTTNKLTTANILTGILGQSAANGSVVKLQIWGY